jgi:hypothetical protein
MMLLLWVVLLIVLLWTFFPMGGASQFKKYKTLVHPYSGLDPVSWQRFLDNLDTFERSVSTRLDEAGPALYAAVESIRDLGLGLRRADDEHVRDELGDIARQLGYEGELILNQNSISQGVYFFPRYLNETLLEYPEYVDTRDPGPVKSHGQ